MFCKKCGNKLSDSAKFCTKCGAVTSRMSQPDVYIHERFENWGMTEEDDEKGKLWIWIIMGIIVTILLTACAVTAFFFLREHFLI
ncbi:MAG: zinc-ribbon domain-containing protein [Lachnospiraceae bacterium]